MQGSVFSEQWFKVAKLNVSLNSSSYIKKQFYRGQKWYVIEDSFNNQFFRVREEAYRFLARLDSSKTVEEIWEESLKDDSSHTPTQDEVISLLTSLHHKNLLYFKNKANTEQLLHRAELKHSKKMKSKVFSFLYFKVPLFDPDRFLDKTRPFTELVFSKAGAIVWFIVIALGIKFSVENFSSLYDQTQGMLSPNKLFLLYISIIILKTLHEFGHSMMVKKFGGKVNEMGVMILVFTPIPYMDATQSWLFRSKYQRALVGAAGMIVELFIAAIAAIIWANTGDGIVNSIAFNMMIIGSVSSIFFNGNPLLRFDSYFILSDLLEIPNLYENSKKQWYYLVEKYIFKLEYVVSPSQSLREAFWLCTYSVLSFFYRLFVAFLIALFVADQWFFLGVLVVLISLYMWILKPWYEFFKYLFTNNKLQKTRIKAISISASVIGFIFIIVAVIPFPFSLKANGIVMTDNYQNIFLKTDGYLNKIHVKDGEFVNRGDVLLSFENKELDFEIQSVYASIKETNAYMVKARTSAKADMNAINNQINLLNDKLKYLEEKKDKLFIKADKSGYFIHQEIKNKENTWFQMGQRIGMLLPDKQAHFQAVIPQEESFNIFANQVYNGSLKLHGLNEHIISVDNIRVIPYQKQELPSAALGWLGGGDIAVSQKDNSGTKTKESFFEVKANIIDKKEFVLQHGRSGILKIQLEPKTLVERMITNVKQILQKHYKI